MANCIKIRRKKEQACIAALNRRIDIFVREITPISTETVDFNEAFLNQRTVWANIVTKVGAQFFDENNILQRITHVFVIRFIPDVTFQNFLVFQLQRYRIVEVENLEQSDTYYRLSCTIRGTDLLEVTKV